MDLSRYIFLVTGGAGFIGSNLTKELLSRGATVRAFDNLSTGKEENISEFLDHQSFIFIKGDLRNVDEVDEVVCGVDYILHQGALPSVPRSIADPVLSNNVNINGTLNILEAAKKHKVKRVVFASSSSVYGDSRSLPKTEDMPVAPLSPYAMTKYAGERYCQIYYKIYGLETVCLRYFNVFGPKQDPTSQYSAVIPKFIKLIKEGKSPVIFGDGLQSRDFTYVSNNVEANILACFAKDAPGEVFNIACGERYTLNELVDNLNKLLGTKVIPLYQDDRVGDIKHSHAGIDKAKRILNFRPVTSFNKGLTEII